MRALPQHARVTTLLLASLILVLAVDGASARPKKRGKWVVGKVVQLTFDHAWVNFGKRYGLRKGDSVSIRQAKNSPWQDFKVDTVGNRYSVVVLPPGSPLPPAGSVARALWRRTEQRASLPVAALPPTEPTAQQLERWSGVDRARPELIPYRETMKRHDPRHRRGVHGAFRLEYVGMLNLGSEEPRHYNWIGLSSTLRVSRLFVDWLDYAHHLRGGLHLARDLDARPFTDSRSPLLVYQMRLGIELQRLHAQLGRMVGAALPEATTIDGASVRARLTPWLHIGGFGGLMPRSDDLRPDTDGGHFGGYSSLRFDHQRDWSLAADAGFVGSTWQGEIDRRAISGRVVFDTRHLALAASAVVDLYPADHPSGLTDPELTGLSVLVDGQPSRWLRIGGRFDRYRFVPTLENLAVYPLEVVAGPPTLSARGHIDINIGVHTTISAQGGYDRQDDIAEHDNSNWAFWGELMLRLHGLLGEDQLRISALANHGTLLSGIGGRLTYLRPVADWLSFTLDYGLVRDRYVELSEGAVWRHDAALGSEATFGQWLLTTEARLIADEEAKLLQLLGLLGYQL